MNKASLLLKTLILVLSLITIAVSEANAQEITTQSTKESNLTVEVGVKIGNAYVDAAYAWKAVADAQKKAVEAAEKLKKMERLQDEGKASKKAVELAAAQLIPNPIFKYSIGYSNSNFIFLVKKSSKSLSCMDIQLHFLKIFITKIFCYNLI
jgi:hypothetical protein